MVTQDFSAKTKALIDDLKGVCASYGLGNDGNEYKIITQAFLFKYLNDKFGHEVKRLDPNLAKAEKWEVEIAKYSEKDYAKLLQRLGPNVPLAGTTVPEIHNPRHTRATARACGCTVQTSRLQGWL